MADTLCPFSHRPHLPSSSPWNHPSLSQCVAYKDPCRWIWDPPRSSRCARFKILPLLSADTVLHTRRFWGSGQGRVLWGPPASPCPQCLFLPRNPSLENKFFARSLNSSVLGSFSSGVFQHLLCAQQSEVLLPPVAVARLVGVWYFEWSNMVRCCFEGKVFFPVFTNI